MSELIYLTDVAVIKVHRAIDGWDAHPVTVVSDARNDTLHDPPWMQDAIREFIGREVWSGETKYIRVANWFCA